MKSNQRRHFLKTSASMATVVAGAGLLAACGGSDDPAPLKNIVELAKGNPDLSILVEAVIAAKLDGTLSAPGTFTVFAPTNAAFADLLKDLNLTKAALLADTKLLTSVLTYHVLGSVVKKAAIPLGKAIDPILTGTSDIFKIDVVGANVVITDGRNRKSNITATDIEASNGVVHVIDKVILPADKNIVATAIASAPEFSTLVAAIQAVKGLQAVLEGTGPFTVFAPTNAAFDNLRQELAGTGNMAISVSDLLKNPNLEAILKYHVVSGRVLKADVPVGPAIATVQGETFTVSAALAITDQEGRTSNITLTDVLTSNGVIHKIDKVILPNILP
jgi:uncharacterized surface protein with fasciclin (FAS1) repeats